MSVESTVRAVTTLRLTEMKQRGEKIAMLTSYDYSMAKIVDKAGIDVILVAISYTVSSLSLPLAPIITSVHSSPTFFKILSTPFSNK